jgi:hypothetical protein
LAIEMATRLAEGDVVAPVDADLDQLAGAFAVLADDLMGEVEQIVQRALESREPDVVGR